MQFLFNLFRIKGPLHVSSITCSFSEGVTQATLGMLRARYVTWLHQDWSGATPVFSRFRASRMQRSVAMLMHALKRRKPDASVTQPSEPRTSYLDCYPTISHSVFQAVYSYQNYICILRFLPSQQNCWLIAELHK
jgi:hypothetical protein